MNNDTSGGYRDIGRYLGLGINLAVTIVVFVYIGKWLDTRAQRQDGLWTLVMAGVGFFAGLYHFIKSVLAGEKKEKRD